MACAAPSGTGKAQHPSSVGHVRAFYFEQGGGGFVQPRRLKRWSSFRRRDDVLLDASLLWCLGPGSRHTAYTFSHQPALPPPARLGRRFSVQCPRAAIFPAEGEEGEAGSIASPEEDRHSSSRISAQLAAAPDADAVTIALAAPVLWLGGRSTGRKTPTPKGLNAHDNRCRVLTPRQQSP
jgi:hypothetical protein